jgi:5-methylcytosine-specific restriction endonuclease McrA
MPPSPQAKAKRRLGVHSVAEGEAKLRELELERERIERERLRVESLIQNQKELWQRAKEIGSDRANMRLLFGRVALGIKPEAKLRVEVLRRKAEELNRRCPDARHYTLHGWSSSLQSQRQDIQTKLNIVARYLAAERGKLRSEEGRKRRIEREQEKDRIKREREARLARQAELAQAHLRSMRDEAAAIRVRLARTTKCPYCGGPLGDSAHADHIHPVAKGGLSTAGNMVLVCQPCNIKKKDMTLNRFIQKHRLDQKAVFARLARLQKDF